MNLPFSNRYLSLSLLPFCAGPSHDSASNRRKFRASSGACCLRRSSRLVGSGADEPSGAVVAPDSQASGGPDIGQDDDGSGFRPESEAGEGAGGIPGWAIAYLSISLLYWGGFLFKTVNGLSLIPIHRKDKRVGAMVGWKALPAAGIMVSATVNRPETRSTQRMLPRSDLDRIQMAFDDHRGWGSRPSRGSTPARGRILR